MSDMPMADRITRSSSGSEPDRAPLPDRVALMITCVADVLAPEVAEATVHVLRASGTSVSCDLSQTCCGQPAWNAGFPEHAATVARPTLAALTDELDRGAEAVVVPAGSCATMIRLFWVELFELVDDDEAIAAAQRVADHTYELSELLARSPGSLGPLRLPEPRRVALHQSCHMLRELQVRTQPTEILEGIDGCEVLEWEGSDRCCGFGGTFSVKLPETSVAMADEKLRALRDAKPDVLVGCDSSCLMHLQGRAEALGTPVEVRHVAEVVADALPLPPDRGRTGL